jgi:hypothetical protein
MKAKKSVYKSGGNTSGLGKMKKYLAGGQVNLDKNKDGKISGKDFKMMKKYQVGGVTPEDKMIEDEIKATRVVSAAVPNRQDLEAAYKASYRKVLTVLSHLKIFSKKE